MCPEHDDHEDRPSWRDIDKKKDRSKHVSDDSQQARPKSAKKEWVQKMYLKEIENLFKGKKATREHAEALEAIHQRAGTKKFNSTVKKYIKEYGMPDDWSTLFLLLDYREIKVVKQAIRLLIEKVPEESLAKREGLKSKLNIMAMTGINEDLRELAEETIEEL